MIPRLAVFGILVVSLAGCSSTVQPTDVERATVCMSMNKLASYGLGPGAGLEVARTALTSRGRTADEAAEIIESVIRTDCPQYRQYL
jgi:hypothetical protein